MILIIHQHAKKLVRVSYKGDELKVKETNLCRVFWKLAEEYPDEIIAWCEEQFESDMNLDYWNQVFHHDLIMASYALKTDYLPKTIGYIDQLPFVNVNREVKYPTWRMSTDVGGIKGRVLFQFQEMFGVIRNFGFLLNSIAKLGQQNGLFCYSVPGLVREGGLSFDLRSGQATQPDILGLLLSGEAQPDLVKSGNKEGLRPLPSRQAQPDNGEGIKIAASKEELFSFVYAHYKSIRLWLLFWCFLRYEKEFPIVAFITALFRKKYFKKNIDLSGIELQSNSAGNPGNSIDVIIPTLGRKPYLLQVLEDLKVQSLLPKRVIIVEQNPDSESQSDLPELQTQSWPFKIVHHFTHKTGACNARNIALEGVTAGWIFFADDDIRFEADLLQKSLEELKKLGADCLNINCKQEGEKTVFPKTKQWGSFGSGTSIVNANYCKHLSFDEVFEYGFGEDQDYGMQLRNNGCDIIYHPHIDILHLKAPRGGFRDLSLPPWEKDKPKPSPTLLVYAKKYYTAEQLKSYKNELFLRYYSRQQIRNPIKYLKTMRKRWRRSEEWADRLMRNSVVKDRVDRRRENKEEREKRIKNQDHPHDF
ncbi:glycosyltransferase [Salegentibacter sp. JZCK2]|uniref:glycosyltransferase family 2 protein n=1 Tax=Salegentibacter tibetensis TaxID=2873600 RepID=UPI001CCB8EA9|nr:glycosyltransferase [Salegentibacter tibetensis]MBZ9729760.1 glycosyltransferase [Salegentibacter tibetensis]